MCYMDIYVCSTPYHIFVSICLIKKNENMCSIYLTTNDKEMKRKFEEISIKLLNDKFIESVYIRKRNKYLEFFQFERLKDQFEYRKVIKHKIASSIYLFPWNPYTLYTLSNFWFKKSDNIILVEDAANVYAFPKPAKWKLILKKIIFNFDENFFDRKKVNEILVQYPDLYYFFQRDKLQKLDLDLLFSDYSVKEKEQLISLFIDDSYIAEMKKLKANVIVILTQPLSEDGYISEAEKIKRYEEIIEMFYKKFDIIIKRHPREKTIYNFEGVLEFDGSFPSELFTLLEIRFSKAIGICTSAIDFLDAKEKFNTDENFFKHLES